MKITELTKEDYHKAIMAALGKARKLAGRTTGLGCDPKFFYSTVGPCNLERVCNYSAHSWSEYRVRAKKGVARITHFINLRCQYACPETKTDCLAKVGNREDGFKYYQCTHLVGQCPWKE